MSDVAQRTKRLIQKTRHDKKVDLVLDVGDEANWLRQGRKRRKGRKK